MVALASSAPAASPEKPLETTNFTSNPAVILVLYQPCSTVFRADLLPHDSAVGGGGGEAVPGDADGGGA